MQFNSLQREYDSPDPSRLDLEPIAPTSTALALYDVHLITIR